MIRLMSRAHDDVTFIAEGATGMKMASSCPLAVVQPGGLVTKEQKWNKVRIPCHSTMSGNLLHVHIGSGLVEHQYCVLPEQGPCQTHQLPLTSTEVGPSLCDVAMQLPF